MSLLTRKALRSAMLASALAATALNADAQDGDVAAGRAFAREACNSLPNRSNTPALEPATEPTVDPRCLWCDRTFTPRSTGGLAQRFWDTGTSSGLPRVAGRLRAIEAGLLGRLLEDIPRERARCLKGIPTQRYRS
jgi:hypothetical protein